MNLEIVKEFFLKNETKIVLVVGFCLVSAISFEFGFLQGQKWQQKPLVIEKPSDASLQQESASAGNSEPQGTVKGAASTSQANKTSTSQAPANTTNCAFVGSKNSDKYYLPTCSYAKRVKPENLICFKSADEALRQGRTESKCK
jgi:hypothetical protein